MPGRKKSSWPGAFNAGNAPRYVFLTAYPCTRDLIHFFPELRWLIPKQPHVIYVWGAVPYALQMPCTTFPLKMSEWELQSLIKASAIPGKAWSSAEAAMSAVPSREVPLFSKRGCIRKLQTNAPAAGCVSMFAPSWPFKQSPPDLLKSEACWR